MKPDRLFIQSLLAVLILSLASGCAITKDQVVVKQSAMAAGQLLPHHVALVLSPELAGFQSKIQLVGETDTYPLGTALQNYSQDVASKFFQQIDVVTNEDKAVSTDDLTLIPRAVKSATSFSGVHWNSTLVVEWTAKNRADQNTIWLKTISASATEYMGNAFTGGKHKRILFQKLFDDLNSKTCNELQKAAELH